MAITRIKNNQITDQTITNVKIASGTLTGDLMNPQLTFNSNLVLNGNLTVTGNVTAVQSQTTQITDPLITLAQGNPGTSYDIGSVLIRGSGGNRFMGWKESAAAFVFISTTDDGTTAGNIATTAYSNVIFGNATTIGSSTFGGITLSGNTVASSGGLILNSGSGTTTLSNAVVMNSTLAVTSTLNVQGTATVNALVSNGAIQGTTIGGSGIATFASVVSNGAIQGTTIGASANATVNALTVNNSATVGTTLGVTGNLTAGNISTSGTATVGQITISGGIQNTPIGNATPSTGNFTTLTAGTSFNTSGTATVNALVSNGAIQGTTVGASGNATVSALTVNNSATVGSTLSAGSIQNTPIGSATPSTGNFTTLTAGTSFNTSGTATVNALVSNGAIQGTAISGSGTGTFASVVSNGAIQGTTIGGSGTATFASVVSNGAIQGTSVSASANATVNALTVNNSATVGTTLSASAGIQNTPIGNVTPSTGNFTTLQASGTATVNALVSNGAIQGTAISGSGTGTFASVVSNGAIQGTAISASGNATVAALTVNASATVGTTLSAGAGVQNTPIGNATPNTGNFTTLNTTGAITGATTIVTTGAATHSALTVNGAATVGTTLVTGGTATVNALTSNTSITAASGQITGNLVVGNLNVQGNLSYINSQSLIVQDPIVELNTGANGAPLSSNPGFDSGIRPHYYDSADRSAFFGRTNDTGYFEYYSNVASETGNVITGTYGTIKTGNLLLTGKANVASDMTIGGALIANQFSVNSTFTASSINATGDITTSGGNIRANAGQISGSTGYYTGNLTVLGNINGVTNVVATNAGVFYGNTVTGFNALYAGIPTGYAVVPNEVAQFSGNANSYVQINAQNINSGNQATTDWIATSPNGTDTTYYVDLGIAGQSYDNTNPNNSLGTALNGGDSYLYAQGNLATTYGGNLVIGTNTGNKIIRFIAGGHDTADITATISNTALSVLRTTVSTNSTNGALIIAGGAGIAGAINGGSTLNVTGTATVNALASNGAIQGTAISGSGTGTFASVVSNGAIQGTTVSASANATVNALTVNASATVGTTLSAAAGVQNTPIGNVTPNTGNFTTLNATGAITGATTLTTTGTATVNALVSNGAIQGTTIGASGNATVSALTVNGSATVGTTLSATGGIQNTPIGNGTASSGNFTTLNATGAITGATTLTITGATQENTLTVNTKANIGTDLTVLGNVYIGSGANASTFTNPIFIGVDSGAGYVQAAIVNTFGNASADYTAYANNGNDVQGWMDMGMTGNVFNDSKYTITGYNDGYIFANGVTGNSSLGGNLVIATGSGGAANDIVFATGGFLTANEVMRFSNSAAALQVKTTTRATGTTSGALQVSGGAGVAGNLFVGGIGTLGNITLSNLTISSNLTNTGITINPNGTGQTTINGGLNSSKTVINGTTANTLVVSGTQVGVNTASFISGATFQVNAPDSMLLPVGAQGDRPGTPQQGMIRFSTTQGSIEWYNGTSWATASTAFTVATANTQTGNGSATIFTLPVANASTAGTIVSINGIVQQPITAYSVSGSTVTFTEAPASTDVIDFRILTTTTTVTSVVDAFGTTGLFLDTPTPGNKIILFKTNGSETFSIQANGQSQFTGNIVPTANITYGLGTSTNRWKDLWLSGSTIYMGNIQIKETAGTVSFLRSDGTSLAAVNADVSDAKGIQGTVIGNVTPAAGYFTTLSTTSDITTTGTGTANIGSSGNQFNTIFAKATSAQYADLAENYLGTELYTPGTVVEFGGEAEIQVCDTDMSTRIAGVVSTNPAFIMNDQWPGAGPVNPIALQGRVPCFVKGKVRKGDMMVSAGNGFARAESKPVLGSVIGKALENFDGDEGVIEVVVGRM